MTVSVTLWFAFCSFLYVAVCHPGQEYAPRNLNEQENQSLNTIEHNSISNELHDVLMEVRKIESKSNYGHVLEKIAEMEENFAGLQMQINNLKQAGIRDGYSNQKKTVQGVTTYVRWGRKVCPGNGSEAIYNGFAAGSYYNYEGGAANMLCLTRDPEFADYDDAVNSGAYIYGTEYRTSGGVNLFPDDKISHDVPCVVCEVGQRSSTMMIPGRKTCYPGWTREYWGYLMAGYYTHKAPKDYYCIDAQPEQLFAGSAVVPGSYLYFVQSRCMPLQCPPYVEGRELTCVVCTK